MSLGPGARLGPYEILSALGAGGMGEVYRARDTKLGRDVALKVIPDTFALDPDRVARFQREAQVLASLNHPHIAAIYGFEDSGETHALVLELVEGETLADRIARGPIPVDEALPIARQIAEALEAAHEQGIVHRDLKPANIKITPDGVVKVLDFGLAKLALPESNAGRADVTASPTITSPAMMTGVGVILGTAAYMAPEQAKGREADKRSDIWAFGCVLYEMLTGTRPFEGEDVTDVMVALLSKEPDWTTLPANVPAPVRTLLRRCLEKDRKRRLDSAAAARLEIDEGPGTATPTGPANVHLQIPRWRRVLPWAVALGAGLALVLTLWAPWRTAAPPAQVRLEGGLGADVSLAFSARGAVLGPSAAAVLSPDGQTLAFVAQKGTGGVSQLYVRRLDQLQARLLSGSDDASSPFFSPDGQWIAFFAGGKLKKISLTGGAAVALCDAPTPRGGVWADAGTIVFQPIGTSGVSLMRVSSAGGKPEPLTTLAEGEATQRYPQVLPGGKAVLFTSNSRIGAGFENANIVVQSLPNGPRKILQRGGYYGRYLPSGTSIGHLVYIHEGTLFAAPFDLDRLELAGQPVPAIEGVASATTAGSAQFAASDTGTLVYVPGQRAGTDAPISWMDHTGKATPLRAAAADWSNPHFSPDGRRLVIDIGGGSGAVDVWVYEWARDTLTRLTFDPNVDRNPVWTADGRRIVFASARGDKLTGNLYWQRADGTGEAQRLTESKNTQYPASWHPSGKFLAFEENMPQTSWDLVMLPMEGDEASGWKPGKPAVFLNSPANEREPMFSPDGRWLAYESSESGQYEVYVRPFPGPGGKWQISTGGGTNAIWSRARRELFFETPDQHLMVAPYSVDGESFRADKPHLWSDARFETRSRLYRNLDLHPDGERFALAAAPDAQGIAVQSKVVFIFNFFDELRRIAPVTKR